MDRYNQTYHHGVVSFDLNDYIPDPEECRFLILKIVEQSVRDYLSLFGSDLSNDKHHWETAAGFIFDPEYMIIWGDTDISLEDLLDIVDINISYFRKRIIERFRERHGVSHAKEEARQERANGKCSRT